jgi:chemotaxis protein CheD
MATISVGISDWKIGKGDDQLVTYALGSCVGICLYDGAKQIAGLSHIMLPDSNNITASTPVNRMKFADTAIVDMYKKMLQMGANHSNITAKIAGGALMFATSSEKFNIGERNVAAVRKALADLRLRLVASDTGLNYGRTVFLHADTGLVVVKASTQGVRNL